ncbi:MAG: NTP transferase domain-containing protein [Candidatus Omnitrophica bacterium]|jgi:bifunctional UDP-N-acetylglucosamine pyrophosphorylase/glucosamine-1-phosphate N-acetyltransferase|nr:NTP transferase domain-containing protein [Candidatus Omnitrophota bacterium]
MKNFTAIILAAGKGVRMKSNLPKVLHELREKPLIGHVLSQLKKVKAVKQVIVVTGYKASLVEAYVKNNFKGINFVRQHKLQGTADAVKSAQGKVKHDNVLILCADTPLITEKTISSFILSYQKQNAKCAVISACVETNNDLGRIIRDSNNNIEAICEKQDLTVYLSGSQSLREVNSGIYAFDKLVLFANLKEIKKNEKKGEYFFTDIIEILYRKGIPIESYLLSDNDEIVGVNSRGELALAEKILNTRVVEEFMEGGVRIIDPQTTFIKDNVKIGKNTLIYPFTFIEKNVIIGSHCRLGPFIHLREGTRVDSGVGLGNFVEICRSKIGKTTRIKHFSYIGDATIGTNVNIGAGTVVANYDGKTKSKTVIGNNSFIGSDSVLVAPLNIGNHAVTGAGSVVRRNVKSKTVVVGVPARFLKKINKKTKG